MIVMNEKGFRPEVVVVASAMLIAVSSLSVMAEKIHAENVLVKQSPDMDVSIELWDPINETWVKNLRVAVKSQMRIRLYVHNVGDFDLFNVTIVCRLPPMVEYVNGSSDPYEPESIEGNTITWVVTSLYHCCGGEAFENYIVVNVTEEGFGTCSMDVSAYYTEEDTISKYDLAEVTAFVDENPPEVEITKPVNALYICGKRGFPLPGFALIVGGIEIRVESRDQELWVEKVEIYIDDEKVAELREEPYVYEWNEKGFGVHRIKAVAWDGNGNHAEDSIRVVKIF